VFELSYIRESLYLSLGREDERPRALLLVVLLLLVSLWIGSISGR